MEFLSTFPLRGTSWTGCTLHAVARYFYPRSPCGERLAFTVRCHFCVRISIHVPLAGNVVVLAHALDVVVEISIHVPLAGNVSLSSEHAASFSLFLSTFPLRGTSKRLTAQRNMLDISIHVPLAGNVKTADYAA